MAKLNFVGPSSQQRSLPFNAERTVNYYGIADKDGKNAVMLQGTPGLELFTSAGVGPGRGSFTAAGSGRYFVVSNSVLYEVTADGNATLRGSLLTDSGVVLIAENGVQMFICDGTYGYIFTYATNAFAQIVDVDFPNPCGTVDFIGGYFIVSQRNTGKFYISDLYNGLSWQALNFATAESSPDNLERVIAVNGQLWLLGGNSAEVWTLTGSVRFPFELISGAIIDMGVYGPFSAEAMDGTMFMVGKNREGSRIVYRMAGFTPQRISTEGIERLLGTITDPGSLRTWKYQEEGHLFLAITGGGMKTSLFYDLTTKLWAERAYLNLSGEYELHLGSHASVAFGKVLVTDRRNGNIYRMALDIYSDNGAPMASDRIFTNLTNENGVQHYGRLIADFETGVGTQTGQGYDPQVIMSMSNDGGRTWGNEQRKSLGKVGQFLTRCIFYQLGAPRNRTFRLRVTDPVKRALVGLYLE